MKHDFSELKLDRVTRRFAGAGGKTFNALDELTLTIKRGEFICLLGPSGCGKSTALNCIAGLLQLSSGSIRLDDTRIDTLPPERRGFGMVFQNYALFPHMTVAKNIGFGLRMRGVPAAAAAPRVARVLKLVKLAGRDMQIRGVRKLPLAGKRAFVAMRPEEMSLHASADGQDSVIAGNIDNVEYAGRDSLVDVVTASGVRLHVRAGTSAKVGDRVQVHVPVDRALVYPA